MTGKEFYQRAIEITLKDSFGRTCGFCRVAGRPISCWNRPWACAECPLAFNMNNLCACVPWYEGEYAARDENEWTGRLIFWKEFLLSNPVLDRLDE